MDDPRSRRVHSRRRLLRLGALALGSSLAGCAWNDGPSTGMTRTAGTGTRTAAATRTSDAEARTTTREPTGTTRTPTETPTLTTDPDESVLDLSVEDLSFDVEVTQQFSEEHPARIRATFTNESDMLFRLLGGQTPPFSRYWAKRSGGDDLLCVLPDEWRTKLFNSENGKSVDEGDFVRKTAGTDCWQAPAELAIGGALSRTKLAPGESVSMGYTVLGYAENDGCLPLGSYRASETQFLSESPVARNRYREAELGFTLALSRNDSLSAEANEPTFAEKETTR